MKQSGGCHCGAVRYRVDDEPIFVGVCHCDDCRASSGAIAVGWFSMPSAALTIDQGETVEYASSPGVTRHFCGKCGTGLFYYNEGFLPGLVDIQLTTLDDPASCPPQMHLQMADALPWIKRLGDLPHFDRYPESLMLYHTH